MAALPYMQLYPADYLADTMHLDAEEHGAYLLLLFNYWQTGKPIPKERLHKIVRMSLDQWRRIEPTIAEFFEDDGEAWIHLRIEKDLETVNTSPRGRKLPDGQTLKDHKGYVYFVTSSDSDQVKIGYSKNPWARLNELRRSYGSQMTVVATVKTVAKSEVSIHKVLDEFRLDGEWFSKTDTILSLIRAISDDVVTTVAGISDYVDSYVAPTTTTTNTDTDTDTDTDKNINNNPPPPSASDGIADAFEVFWSAGMKKSDKKKSLAAFRRQCKGHDPQEFAATLADDVKIRIHLEQFGFDRLMPTTYLNGERWNDEYPKPEATGVSSYEKRNPTDNSAAGRVRASIERENAQQHGGTQDWATEDADALEFDGFDVRP